MAIRKIGSEENFALDQSPQNQSSSLRKLSPGENITLDSERAIMTPRAASPVYYPKQEADTSIGGHLVAGTKDFARSLYGLSANVTDRAADAAENIQFQAQKKLYDVFGYPVQDENLPDTLSVPQGNIVSRGLRESATRDSEAERILQGQIDAMNVQDTVKFEEISPFQNKITDINPLQVGRFALEQGARSLPYMGAAFIPFAGIPIVTGAISQNVMENRLESQGLESTDRPSDYDMQVAAATALPSAALERLGVLGDIGKIPNPFRAAGGGTVRVGKDFGGAVARTGLVSAGLTRTGRVLKSGAGEAGTEFLQEDLELFGGTTGTDVDPSLVDYLETGLQGAVVGGPMGGGIRAATEAVDVARTPDYRQTLDADVTKGFTEQSMGTDTQNAAAPEAEIVQIELPPNRDDLADAINNDTPVPDSRTVDVPVIEIDPVLQAQGLVIGAKVEQVNEFGEVSSGVVTAANEFEGELEVTVMDENGELRTLFASQGDIVLEGALDQDVAPLAPPAPEPVIEEPIQVEPIPPSPLPALAPEETYDNMGVERLTSVLGNIKAQAKQSGWNKLLTDNSKKIRKQLDERFPEWDIPKNVDLFDAAQDVAPEPSDGQKEAGNYKKGHVSIQGLPITLENPKGSIRSGKDRDGTEWQTQMPAHYGYIKRTEGADGDHVDVYIGDNPSAENVFVVDQIDKDTKDFDEHKIMIGFPDEQSAVAIYNQGFSDGLGAERSGAVTQMTVPEFKDWLKNSNNKKSVAYKKTVEEEVRPEITPAPVQEEYVPENAGDLGVLEKYHVEKSATRNVPPFETGQIFRGIDTVIDLKKYEGGAAHIEVIERLTDNIVKRLAKSVKKDPTSDKVPIALFEAAGVLQTKIREAEAYMDTQDAQQQESKADDDIIPAEEPAPKPEDQAPEIEDQAPEPVAPEPPQVEEEDRPVEGAVSRETEEQDQESLRTEETAETLVSQPEKAPETGEIRAPDQDTDKKTRTVAGQERPEPFGATLRALYSMEKAVEKDFAEVSQMDEADVPEAGFAELEQYARDIEAEIERLKADGVTLFEKKKTAPKKTEQKQEVKVSEQDKAQKKAASVQVPQGETIEDFGEKLHGAKKDLWTTYDKILSDELPDDLSKITLSKHFPEPNYEKLIEGGADIGVLATIKAMRDEIPSKPRVKYKLERWAENVRIYREFSHDLLSSGTLYKNMRTEGEKIRGLGNFFDRVELYKELGYPAFTNAKDWTVRKSDGAYENGKPIGRRVWFVSHKSSWGDRFDTREEAIEFLKKKLENPEAKARKTKLDVYRVTKTGEIIIGKKVAAGKFIDLKGGFENGREARKYVQENYDDLIALLKKKKDVPPVRRSTNDPRIGEDYREGKDITPEEFSDTFGFRGVQFGNYVEQKKRANDLNNAFDALTDLSRVIGVPEKALSLNGGLGLAFGARGSGGKGAAAAHYEPGSTVINLTKNNGAGSLGHEWFHAMDNYFGKKNEGGMITESAFIRARNKDGTPRTALPVRKEVIEAYNGVLKAIKQTDIKNRSKELDKLRTKDYWSTPVEMTARSFESYLIHKSDQKGGRNDYLANIGSQSAFEAVMGEGTYPYPLESEMDVIIKAYDNLFETIETKETDAGVAMFRKTDDAKNIDAEVSGKIQKAINKRLKALGWPEANFRIYGDPDQLQPLTGLDESVEGFYWRGIIHVATSAKDILGTINHEIIHGLKSFGAFTDAEWSTLEAKAPAWREKYNIDDTYKSVLEEQGVTDPDMIERKLNEEAIAHAFQDESTKGFVRRLANRAVKFIKTIGDVMRGRPFNLKTAEDIFAAVEGGDVGKRLAEEKDAAGQPDFPMYKLGKAKKPALDTAKKSLANIRGLEHNMMSDLKRISSLVLHPQQIATLYKEFTPVYRAVIERFKQREVLVHQLSKNIDLYNGLDVDSKSKVNAVLEIGRLSAKTYKTDVNGGITVKNVGLEDTVHSKDGDSITLTPTEAAAYIGVRKSMDMALDKYIETLLEEYGLAEQGAKTIQDVEKMRLEAVKEGRSSEVRRFKQILATLNDVMDSKKRGYIPLKRWGEIGVSVKDADGDVVHFERIELGKFGRKDRIGENKAVEEAIERLGEKFNSKDYDINFFEMNKLEEVSAHLDLRNLDILAATSDMNEADYKRLREMLEKEMQKKGFRSHFFQSRDVSGYSEDFERAINDYVVSISSYISRRLNERKIDESVGAIADSGKPGIYDYARAYQEYANDPKEELSSVRMMGFFWYLAGNLSSGLVNLTQPFLVTAPWFSAKFSHTQIGKEMSRAYKDAVKLIDFKAAGMDVYSFDKAPKDVREALIKAQDEGDFLSLATYDAMAISNSNTQALRGLEKKKRLASEAIALTFSVPEKTNRVVTFIAAYRLAIDPKNRSKIEEFIKSDNFGRSMLEETTTQEEFAFAYAEYAVVSTQYRVGKLNRPTLTRSYGTLVFQFWSFMLQTLELMYKLGKVHGGKNKMALGVMMMSVVAVAGMKGVPFEDDLQEIIEGLYKFRTGKDLDIDTDVREFLAEKTNPVVADAIINGLPSALLNVDMSGRLGFGNIAPDDGADFLGVWYDMLYERPVRAGEAANRGDYLTAISEVAPAFLRNPIQSYVWSTDGVRTQRGKKVIDASEVTEVDAALKFFGFTSSKIANKRDLIWAQNRANSAVNDLRSRYYSRIAKALAERKRSYDAGDKEAARQMTAQIEAIKQEVNRHNQSSALHERIILHTPTIKRRFIEEIKGSDSSRGRKQARPRKEELKKIYGY